MRDFYIRNLTFGPPQPFFNSLKIVKGLKVPVILLGYFSALDYENYFVKLSCFLRACLKRRHVYVAAWPKLILTDVYQCLRRWPQPQGQNPQK